MVIDYRDIKGMTKQAIVFVKIDGNINAAMWLPVAKNEITRLFIMAEGGHRSEDVNQGQITIRLKVEGQFGTIKIEAAGFYGFAGIPMNFDAPGGWGQPFNAMNRPLGTPLATFDWTGGSQLGFHGATKYWAKQGKTGKPDAKPVNALAAKALAPLPVALPADGYSAASNQTWTFGKDNQSVIGYMAFQARGKTLNLYSGVNDIEGSATVNRGDGYAAVITGLPNYCRILGCGITTILGKKYVLFIQTNGSSGGNIVFNLNIANWHKKGTATPSEISNVHTFEFLVNNTGSDWHYQYYITQPFYFSPDGHNMIGIIAEHVLTAGGDQIEAYKKNVYIIRATLNINSMFSYSVSFAGSFISRGPLGTQETAPIFVDYKQDGTETFIYEKREYIYEGFTIPTGNTLGNWGTKHTWKWDDIDIYTWNGRAKNLTPSDPTLNVYSSIQIGHADLRYGIFAFCSMDAEYGSPPLFNVDFFRVKKSSSGSPSFEHQTISQPGVSHTDDVNGVPNSYGSFVYEPNDWSLTSMYATSHATGDQAHLRDMHFEAASRNDFKTMASFRIGLGYTGTYNPNFPWSGTAMDRHSFTIDWEATKPEDRIIDVPAQMKVSPAGFRIYNISEV